VNIESRVYQKFNAGCPVYQTFNAGCPVYQTFNAGCPVSSYWSVLVGLYWSTVN
jgi:hypothetical protein